MAQPTIDNSGQTAVGSAVASRTISSFVVGAGSNRLIYVVVSRWSSTDRTVSSVVFNTSENFTQLDTHSQAIFGGTQRVDIWYLKNPSVTTANIVITLSGSADEVVCGALSLRDVDQSSTFGTVAKNANTQEDPRVNATVTVSASADAFVFDAVVCGDDAGAAPTATGTSHWNLNNANNNTRGCVQRKNGAASVTMNWTGDHMVGYVTMGVAVNGITAGGTNWGPLLGLRNNRLVVAN